MEKFSDAPNIVQKFLKYKEVTQNRSSKTVFQYYHDLRTFSRYMLIRKNGYDEKDFQEISFADASDELLLGATSEDVFEFIHYCVEHFGNGVSARKRKLSCLNSFYKYVSKTLKMMKDNPAEAVDTPSLPKKLPKFLTLDESLQLLSGIDGKNAIRDYCIITLFLNCGMRVSELVGINLSDISRDLSTVNVTGKGSKERMLYLNDACKSAIEAYLKVREPKPKPEAKDALFVSRNRNRISVQMVQTLIYKHLNNAGLGNRKMSVHKLRHTAATLMYQHGKTDVRVLKDILGHEQMSTTQIYTHINSDMIRDAANSSPLSGITKKPEKVKYGDETDDE